MFILTYKITAGGLLCFLAHCASFLVTVWKTTHTAAHTRHTHSEFSRYIKAVDALLLRKCELGDTTVPLSELQAAAS